MRSWIRRPLGAVLVAAAVAVAATGGIVAVNNGPVPAPTATATATATPGACSAASNCFPKPPGSVLAGATGVPAGTNLAACGGDVTISTPNTVVDSCSYTGSLTITANNVTVRKSRVLGGVENVGANFLIEDSDIGPSSGCSETIVALVRWANYTARRNYLHNNADGFRFSGDNIRVEDNFVTTCDFAGAHSDGLQGDGSGVNNVVTHNTIDIRGATFGPNGAVFFADNSKSATVTNNLLIATGGFALRIHDDANPDIGPWVITGNRLVGNKTTTNTDCAAASMTWSDNRAVTVNAGYEITSTGSLVSC